MYTVLSHPGVRNLALNFNEQARLNPEGIAVIDSDGRRITFGSLDKLADRIRALFPIQKPKRIGLFRDYDRMTIAAYIAIVRSGAVCVLVDNEATVTAVREQLGPAEEVDFVITEPRIGQKAAGYLQMHLFREIVKDVENPSFDEIEPEISDSYFFTASIPDNSLHSGDIVMQSIRKNIADMITDGMEIMLCGASLAIAPTAALGNAGKILALAEVENVSVILGDNNLSDQIALRRMSLPVSVRLLLTA